MMSKRQEALQPKLRFPEFRNAGPWEVKRLGEISDRINEKVNEKQLEPVSISAGKGFVLQKHKFGRKIAGKQYRNYNVLKKGEFSYNRGNSKIFPQGAIYQLREFEEVAVPNAFYSFKFKKEYVPEFYLGYFESNFHGRQLLKFITSSARSDGLLNISVRDFFSIILPTPPNKKEQQKIVDCLSSLDELIEFQSQKLEALKEHKKGLMQQLFPQEGGTTPRLRFPEFRDAGPWEVKRLGEVCSTFSGGTPNSSRKDFYGGTIPFIRSAEIDQESTELFITEDGFINSSAKMIKKGDLLIALYGANSGDASIAKLDGAINQAILCLRSTFDLRFILNYWLLRKESIIQKYIQGGQGNLSGDIVKSIEFAFPSVPEQQKIADCLSTLDELIELESQKLEVLKEHKKGLMQQLFPQEVE